MKKNETFYVNIIWTSKSSIWNYSSEEYMYVSSGLWGLGMLLYFFKSCMIYFLPNYQCIAPMFYIIFINIFLIVKLLIIHLFFLVLLLFHCFRYIALLHFFLLCVVWELDLFSSLFKWPSSYLNTFYTKVHSVTSPNKW